MTKCDPHIYMLPSPNDKMYIFVFLYKLVHKGVHFNMTYTHYLGFQ